MTDKKGKTVFVNEDEHVRVDTTLESLAKLPPVFSGSGGAAGTITAGNSSGITDGASALVLASGERVKELGLKPLARIHDATVAAVDPREMGIGPVPAVRRLEQRTGWKLADYAAIELNEAFAAQVIACDRELNFDRARLESEWRGDRAWPSHRRDWRADYDDTGARIAPGASSGFAAGSCHVVCIGRDGRGAGTRSRVRMKIWPKKSRTIR